MNETVYLKTENIWLDSSHRYGLISRALHWIMAYLLIWQFFSLLTWRMFGPAEWVKVVTSFGPYHGTVGLLVLPLVILRALWALANRHRRPHRDADWQGRAAHIAHMTFYLLMFAIPALALLRAYGNGKGWAPFIPATGEQNEWLTAPANLLHGPLSWTLSILIAVHIVAALFHRFVRKDATLARMAGPLKRQETGARNG